ncbi:MAG TPA: beta-ketoacyl-[acyl-carrier-protein] synthase family protein [Clostridiales bacterium]|nr:MAG: 3-oxoacyl-ACP synthase [Clostridiales bacterium GWD2_32_59]HAN09670.1 beta-ketoacyl-[acyl-carrier-protein] synthase family protein [Clostridiales bacterium]
MANRVVITGIGMITSLGFEKETVFKNILNNKMIIEKVPERFKKRYLFKSGYYVPAPKIDMSEHGVDSGIVNLMEQSARYSVAATKYALEDAGLDKEAIRNADVIMGLGMNSFETLLNSYLAHLQIKESDFEDIKPIFNRMIVPMLMPNSVSAWISILYGAGGTNYTLNASCASGTHAIGEAYRRIKDGYKKIVIAGGSECLREKNGAIMRGFDMLLALTQSQDGHPMPFSNNRSGFLFNEGASCVIILEEIESAINRGATIYAEVCDYQSNSDAHNIVQMNEQGDSIKKLLSELSSGKKIDYLNAHGTGTILNDRIEAKIIRDVFGDKDSQPLINSTKGILGHSIGASGAIEIGVTALSIKNKIVHGNFITDPIENLNLPLENIEVDINYAISTSYGFGGHNAGILLKSVGDS